MSRIGFIILPATGHLKPSIALARALEKHGHEIVFFNVPDTSEAITSAELRFVPLGEAEYPQGALKISTQKIAELAGPAAFAYYVERTILLFCTSFRYLPQLLLRENIELLIIDQVQYRGATIAEHIGIPFVSLANALLVNREELIPPPAVLWQFDPSTAGIECNNKGWATVDLAYEKLLSVVNDQRRAWQLSEYGNLVEDALSLLAQICQQPPVLEFPRPQAPSTLHLVGHLKDKQPCSDVSFPWEWLDGRPLIYVSCGTLQNRLEHVFRVVIEACASLDAQTVIALGKDGLQPESFGAIPSNIKLLPYTPQNELLRHTRFCIFHGGLNRALDCLERGIPMIVIPITSEQPGIAMRIAYLGAGVVVPLSELSTASLSKALRTTITHPAYRKAVQFAEREIAKLHPTIDAVNIIDQVLASALAAPIP